MTDNTPNPNDQKPHMSEPQIKAALSAGIISQSQADAMRQALQVTEKAAPTSPADSKDAMIGHEDDMRFLRSFSDVFIAIGLIFLVLAISGLTALNGGGAAYLISAAIMFIGAEFFGRRHKAHLPTLILALAFLVFIQKGFMALLGGGGTLAAFITMGAMTLFYWRIRLPFCIALVAASAIFLLFSFLGQYAPGLTKSYLGILLALAGLAIFSTALAYDVKDQHRTTRFADNAFWLHFLAAPLIIHGIAVMGVTLKSDLLFNIIPIAKFGPREAIIVLIIVAILTLIGLAINRRALIVSSFGYTGFAIASLFTSTGVGLISSALISLLILGGVIVFLGVGWHKARGIMLNVLPKWRIFPPPFDPNFKS